MDQVFFIAGGVFVAVTYILSPVRLAEKAMNLAGKLTRRRVPAREKAERRSYYVRGLK